jgi:hypothetical protein
MPMFKHFLIALAAIAAIAAAVCLPGYIRSHQPIDTRFYSDSLRAIDAAKHQWALVDGKTTNDTPTWAEILPWLGREFTNCYTANGLVVRPKGGLYTIGRVGEPPSCLVNGRRIVFNND